MLSEAIAHYHALLDDASAHDAQQRLNEGMRAHNLFFGDRPLVTVLRPRLMTQGQYTLLQRVCSLVAQAIRRLVKAAIEEQAGAPAIYQILALTPQEQALIERHPGYEEFSSHSRMDTFLTLDGSSLQFVEYNAESPAAIAYSDVMTSLFLDLPVMQQFQQRYTVRPLPARQRLLDTLLAAWREAGSPGGQPAIAIVDWHGVPTATEFTLFRTYFEAHGLDALICTPDDLVFREGRLYARDAAHSREMPVTILYKRVLTSEFLEHYGDAAMEHPIVQAYTGNTCVVVNSFRAKMLHKKSVFALLTDERLEDALTPEERAAVQSHVPWTRLVRPGETMYQGERVDLFAFARNNRERFILKPNDEYGGKGITIGWECSADDWDRALKAALESPFVVQEKVTIAYEPYPALVDGKVVIADRLTDSDPYLFGAAVDGCLCRLSTATLLNVTAGGGSTVPVFVIEEQ